MSMSALASPKVGDGHTGLYILAKIVFHKDNLISNPLIQICINLELYFKRYEFSNF